ncbi:hypothetical protein [Sedimenticola thiotaurini]|uniref:Uncharacterized protein n=1 Tax=Sedimenticola thiotaurini TaxID=1543721 RepID=A0A0F7K2X1_9GAMM|nr:hypothetical protein [Sedimenticola thiotaurini]AKH21919.1 hypothetical protein AAY24_17975 [Sedimenticola thiotaurini]
MKRIIKWFTALAAILVGLYAVTTGFGIWASHETGKRFDIGYGTSTSPKLVHLEIGYKVFAIPQNYIWSREDWKGGKVQGVNLHALWPDFEPYTEANRYEFDKPGWNRKMDILLREHNIPGSRTSRTSMTRREIYDRILYDYAAQKPRIARELQGPFGLKIQHLSPPRISGDEIYTGRKANGDFYWVQCGQEGKHEFPSCSTYVEYSKYVTIHYSFSRKDLNNWQGIDDAVVAFVNSFEANTKQGGLQ